MSIQLLPDQLIKKFIDKEFVTKCWYITNCTVWIIRIIQKSAYFAICNKQQKEEENLEPMK